MKNRALIIIFVIVTLLVLGSCSNYLDSPEEFYGGELVDSEMLSSLAESILAEEELTEKVEDETTKEEITREHDGTYYWTKSGKVYHKWSDCGYIKNSKEVFDGTLEDAIEAGKENLCSSCAKK